MTTLYRTPNVIMDAHEWHAAVQLRAGRTSLVYRWRPLTTRAVPWSSITQWQGRKPKRMCNRFWPYRLHIRAAMASEAARLAAVRDLKGPATAAVERNRGGRVSLGLLSA